MVADIHSLRTRRAEFDCTRSKARASRLRETTRPVRPQTVHHVRSRNRNPSVEVLRLRRGVPRSLDQPKYPTVFRTFRANVPS